MINLTNDRRRATVRGLLAAAVVAALLLAAVGTSAPVNAGSPAQATMQATAAGTAA